MIIGNLGKKLQIFFGRLNVGDLIQKSPVVEVYSPPVFPPIRYFTFTMDGVKGACFYCAPPTHQGSRSLPWFSTAPPAETRTPRAGTCPRLPIGTVTERVRVW